VIDIEEWFHLFWEVVFCIALRSIKFALLFDMNIMHLWGIKICWFAWLVEISRALLRLQFVGE